MLGQPLSMLIPQVVGVNLTGELRGRHGDGSGADRRRAAATDTESSASSSSSTGQALASVPLADRATIGNMSPEYGSTCAIFPIDDRDAGLPPADRPRPTPDPPGRGLRQGAGAVARPRAAKPGTASASMLDLATIVPSVAGPKRPQDRIALTRVHRRPAGAPAGTDRFRAPCERPGRGVGESFPASDSEPSAATTSAIGPGADATDHGASPLRSAPLIVTTAQRRRSTTAHVVIAAITRCTNTSNPS